MHNRVVNNSTLGMQDQDEDQTGVSTDIKAKTDELLRAFALGLGRELDRIGYPAAPARTNQLALDLGLGRMQAYRIGRGENMPTLKALVKLQSLGVSLDAVLQQAQSSPETEISLRLLDVTLKAVPLPAFRDTPFALSHNLGQPSLRVVRPGEKLVNGESFVGGLRFLGPQPLVAVVDDDSSDLAVLGREIQQGFGTSLFSSGRALLDNKEELSRYDALVLDWRLPDMDGADLVHEIRSHTRAPIIITTGERREAQAISSVLQLPNVRYADKPVDGNILRAMLVSAIAESTSH
jgi:CheY-like chemotaxis protein